MAFPQVQSVTETQFSSASTTHNVSMPATVTSGDLLLIFVTFDETTVTTPSGWTAIYEQEDSLLIAACYAKVADGTEDGGTVNVATGASVEGAAQCLRITGWGGVISSDIDVSASPTQDVSNQPDPGSVTAGWGSADNLYIAAAHATDDDATVSSYPTNYSNGVDTISGGGTNNGATVATARRELAGDSDDPGVFTLSEGEAVLAWTIVIEPAAGGGGAAAFPFHRIFEQVGAA